jgi:magnesium chelatase family protein
MANLTSEEAVEVTRIHSLAGKFNTSSFYLITRPPFRAPHHSASAEGILGGGRTVRPGEISLAHFGILFLDEAPEYKSNVLQALREPLEDRLLTIVRAEGPVKLPADFQLVMAANACPCGKLGSSWTAGDCFCNPEEIHKYWRKFGGALLDRIDIRVPVSGSSQALTAAGKTSENETSAEIQRRVIQAVEIQRSRFKTADGVSRNSRMSPAQVEYFCPLNKTAAQTLNKAMETLVFSGRAYYSILKMARTIADLEAKEMIETDHLLEAIQHRSLGDDPYDVLTVDDV